MKRRLNEQTFEPIISAAMRLDLAPVRLCSLDFARSCTGIRERYNAGDFPHEVLFEMQAVFPLRRQMTDDLSI